MEEQTIKISDQIEYAEFKRTRREVEIQLALKRITVDASRRETDRESLKRACETAMRLGADGVLVSPINVSAARRYFGESGKRISVLVGGTGETLLSVKRAEARRAFREGAREIWFLPCLSQLRSGGYPAIKREIRRARKRVKKCTFYVMLNEGILSEEEILLAVRAAKEGGADGVCIRGETDVLLSVLTACDGKLFTCCTGVENAEQFRLLLKIGAHRTCSENALKISEEMRRVAEASLSSSRAEEGNINPERKEEKTGA